MIKIKVEQGERIRVTSVGHAGDETHKDDRVCAAASMIAYVLGQSLILLDSEGKMERKPKVVIEDGYALIIAKPKEEYYAEAQHCLWSYTVGAAMLEQNYPQYVKLAVTSDEDDANKESPT